MTKLSPNGGALEFSTFLGGSKAERSNAIAVDRAGTAYVTGRTLSPNFPTGRAFHGALRGDIDAFVAKLE